MSNTRQAKAKARIAASLKSRAIAVISDAKKAGDVYVTCTFNGKGSKHVTKVFAAAAIKFSGLSQLDLAKKANVRKHTVGTALAKGTTTTTTLIDIVRAAELNFSIIATPKKTSTKKHR
ncbi:MAG: hypothetical protein EBX50_20965, partial [Chitinophagia bacterium]|nr:hypothetical protein [Chitinophagia bacterium]